MQIQTDNITTPIDPDSHEDETEWITTSDTHKKVYSQRGAVVVAEETHEWGDDGEKVYTVGFTKAWGKTAKYKAMQECIMMRRYMELRGGADHVRGFRNQWIFIVFLIWHDFCKFIYY